MGAGHTYLQRREIMKPLVKIALLLIAIVAALLAFLWRGETIRKLRAELATYQRNTTALLTDVETYRVRDSLNAARVLALELTEKEYKRFREEDAALIADLRLRNRDLSAVNKTQAQTIIQLSAVPHDTVIVVRDSIRVPAVAVHCGDAWYDFDGLLAEGLFKGELVNRDSLLLVETVKYKRFLGFLWRTHKVKDRQLDVVSLNPHTTILGVEHTIIRK